MTRRQVVAGERTDPEHKERPASFSLNV